MENLSFLSYLSLLFSSTERTRKKEKEKNFKFKPVPYLNYNRTGGFEFGAVPMAMYKVDENDTISPESLSGIVGMYSKEGN